jgi:hypothetical protein
MNEKRRVGWIVINETLLDISPKGRFGLIEHAPHDTWPIIDHPRAHYCVWRDGDAAQEVA